MLFVYMVNTSQGPRIHVKKMCICGDCHIAASVILKIEKCKIFVKRCEFTPMFSRIENVHTNIVNNHRTKNALCVHYEYISRVKNTCEKHVLSVILHKILAIDVNFLPCFQGWKMCLWGLFVTILSQELGPFL